MKVAELKEKMEILNLELDEHVLTITLNRPKALNALNNQTLDEMNEVIDAAAADNDVYGVIITGAGRAFVAGADIVQMKPYKSEEGRDYAAYAQATFNKIEALTKPVIAAVNGFALGGGCELALSCDIRLASDKAVFGQPEASLGIIPCFGGTQRLPRLIGPGLAKEMIYTGRQVKAEEALRFGLVNRVVEADSLLAESKALMMDILKVSPLAVKYAKVSINKGADMDLMNALELEKDLVGLCFASEEKEIGMAAFLEKKKANFR